MSGNIVFFGTPQICIPFLETLLGFYDIKLIVTQPDSRGGRNRKIIVPAVKNFAINQKIPFIQPIKLNDLALKERITAVDPLIITVVSYGQYIPRSIFQIPKHRTINVHFSLLPKYRGAAPVQRALEMGEAETGITIFEIDRKMDTGDIWAQMKITIQASDTTVSLLERMSREGAPFLKQTLENILSGKIMKQAQQHELASYAPPITREEGRINWQSTAAQIFNKYRAFTPFPGLFFYVDDCCFKIKRLAVSPLKHESDPGVILGLDRDSLKVCCGEGSVLEILEFQPECKKPMTPYCYSLGNKLPDRF